MAATNTITNLAAQAAQAADIRDIRPLVDIPNPWIWLWIGLGVLLLAAAAVWIWRWLQKRKAETPAAPPIPAHLLARQRLQEAFVLLPQPKPFIIAVSNTLRAYLEDAFQMRAPEQTTEEFLVELQHSHLLSQGQKSSLGDFLQSCDLVKFARYEPRESELRELHAYAVELVAQTEPSPEPAEEIQESTVRPPAPGDASQPSINHRQS
ncbi:MAG: hypothetical protein MUE94_08210 [Verrucomicrobia bacterium]|jgi:hypothetical protein|nr:hypothetical protein [Verrucomicrobiota bacterium]